MAKLKKSKNKKVGKPKTPKKATASRAAAEVAATADDGAPLAENAAATEAPSAQAGTADSEIQGAAPEAQAEEAESAAATADAGSEASPDGVAAEAPADVSVDAAQGNGGGDATQTVLPFVDAPHDETGGDDSPEAAQASPDGARIESIIESLLFASDKALGLSDLKRLLGERDAKKITAAVQALMERHKDTGIQVVALSSGWHLRTHVDNAAWVSRLLVGRPVRLSRAMMETLAIVAYRQPVTRPEVDDIRGVDCGPVLKTLLDRGLVRIIGKKEEVGRPLLYGTTPEFLRVFNLRDLSELPTLREFYDLSPEDQSRVEAEHGEQTPSATTPKPDVALTSVARGELAPEADDTDPLLDELDLASKAAKQVLGDLSPEEEKTEAAEGEAGGEPKADPDPPVPASE